MKGFEEWRGLSKRFCRWRSEETTVATYEQCVCNVPCMRKQRKKGSHWPQTFLMFEHTHIKTIVNSEEI